MGLVSPHVQLCQLLIDLGIQGIKLDLTEFLEGDLVS